MFFLDQPLSGDDNVPVDEFWPGLLGFLAFNHQLPGAPKNHQKPCFWYRKTRFLEVKTFVFFMVFGAPGRSGFVASLFVTVVKFDVWCFCRIWF